MNKRLMLILPCFALVSCASPVKNFNDKHIRVKIEKNQDRRVTIKTTYRDDKKIMTEMSGILNSNMTPINVRALFLNNEEMYMEADEDNDGFFESIMIPGKNINDFEMFIRNKDGSIVPAPTDQYKMMHQKSSEATKKLQKALNSCRENPGDRLIIN